MADTFVSECTTYRWDMIVCPGGHPGAEHLKNNANLMDILCRQFAESKPIAGICAAPAVIFAAEGFLKGKRATCYPAKKFQGSFNISNIALSNLINRITANFCG